MFVRVCGNPSAGVTPAEGASLCCRTHEIMAIPPQLALTIKARGAPRIPALTRTLSGLITSEYKTLTVQPPSGQNLHRIPQTTTLGRQKRVRRHIYMNHKQNVNTQSVLITHTHISIPSRLSSECCVSLVHTHMWHSALDPISARCSHNRRGDLGGL